GAVVRGHELERHVNRVCDHGLRGAGGQEAIADERHVAVTGGSNARFAAGVGKGVWSGDTELPQECEGLIELFPHAPEIVVLRGETSGHPVVTAVAGMMHRMRPELMTLAHQRTPRLAMLGQI